MLRGKRSTNEGSLISFGTLLELFTVSELQKQTTKRNIDYGPFLCLLTDDTKIALHLRDNQGTFPLSFVFVP